ncbi:hypothetical protein Angca_000576, partial [Angiostrongylus cantonensis]
MPRYDDIQGIAMCSVMGPNWDETELGVKPTSNNHVLQDSLAQPHTFQVMQPHSLAIQKRESLKCHLGVHVALRTCFAEFLSVYATTFLSIYVEDELSARHVPWVQKISFMAFIDAMAATMFIAALKTVHFHPAITIAHLFSLTTSWILCIVLLFVQLVASAFANLSIAVSLLYFYDVTCFFQMFSQFFGTAMVVVAHLMSCTSFQGSPIQIGRVVENSSCLFMAIALSSFLSLLQSTCHWNSLQATSICLLRSFDRRATESLYDQYLFWLGPIIGSLLACFLYRL